jgi:hypothetical protein
MDLNLNLHNLLIKPPPNPFQNYKSALHPGSGGRRMATLAGYKGFRSVTIQDQRGVQHERLAAVEFDDRS